MNIKVLYHIKVEIYVVEHIFKNGMSDIFSDRTSQQKGMWTIFHSVKAIIFQRQKYVLSQNLHMKYTKETCQPVVYYLEMDTNKKYLSREIGYIAQLLYWK